MSEKRVPFTPGPWEVKWSQHYPGKPISVSPVLRWNSIAINSAFGKDYSESATNARLISTAPDGYELAKWTIRLCGVSHVSPCRYDHCLLARQIIEKVEKP